MVGKSIMRREFGQPRACYCGAFRKTEFLCQVSTVYGAWRCSSKIFLTAIKHSRDLQSSAVSW
jgi:hypothetical protein